MTPHSSPNVHLHAPHGFLGAESTIVQRFLQQGEKHKGIKRTMYMCTRYVEQTKPEALKTKHAKQNG